METTKFCLYLYGFAYTPTLASYDCIFLPKDSEPVSLTHVVVSQNKGAPI